MARLLLEIESLDVFHGELQALNGVTLYVKEGELVALVGANGAGKTTLINTISGVCPAARGTIRFDGKVISHLPDHERPQRGIVQVPEGRRLFPYLSVKDNLLMGAYNHRARPHINTSLERVYELLPVLRDRQKQKAGSLSGGEQQMVAIGRALMAMPRILMFDEPSLGLAPKIVHQMFELIKAIRKDGVTVFMVEQNVRQTLALSDRNYVLQHGRIAMEGSSRELLARPDLTSQFLGIDTRAGGH